MTRSSNAGCQYFKVYGEHCFVPVYRFPWPWGVPFPKVETCLSCGETL